MDLLPEIIEASDTAIVIDNSGREPKLVFSKTQEKLQCHVHGVHWVQNRIIEPLKADGKKVEFIRESLDDKLKRLAGIKNSNNQKNRQITHSDIPKTNDFPKR